MPPVFKNIDKLLTIAIDGHSGCGKSSTAKTIAKKLNYSYIDTGAMYRAVTVYFLEQKLNFSSQIVVENEIKKISLEYAQNKNNLFQLILNKKHINKALREPLVNKHVGQIASYKSVRNFLVKLQQKWGEEGGVILDGRDIGSHVFPNAEVKIFMTAQLNVRAERRFNETKEKEINMSLKEIKENLTYRDKIDSSRTESPLLQTKDAILVDTTFLTFDEQVREILDIIYQKLNINN